MHFDQPPPEPLASAVGFLLSWNGRRIAHMFATGLEPLGLKPPHFGVLSLIAAQPGRSQHQIGERSMIDPSSMVAIVDELERLGLAERRLDPEDRRRRTVHLTRKGSRTLERARTVAIDTAEEVLGPLDEKERDTLRVLLRKLAGLPPEGAAARSTESAVT
jgi:MarR family transcriptional regulator, lower aerobic nicotinate degradation pathway regulator